MAITITHKDKNDETSPAMFGEEEHLIYSTKVTFSELVFTSISSQKPSIEQLKLFNLILNLCFDHGPNAPSGAATVAATKEGKEMGEAVAAGIAQINERHGGAIEPLMKQIYKIEKGKRKNPTLPKIVEDYIKEGKKFPGFGHRIYKYQDPRAQVVLKELEKAYGSTVYDAIVSELEYEIEKQLGNKLPINIDGAIAVVLCTWGWEPEWSKAVFIIARAGGLTAHFLNNRA